MKIWENVKYGLPLDGVRVIDAHGHCGNYDAFFVPEEGSPEAIVKRLDNLGVECAFLSTNLGFRANHSRGNEQMAEAIRKFPGRIYGYI